VGMFTTCPVKFVRAGFLCEPCRQLRVVQRGQDRGEVYCGRYGLTHAASAG
jgi:hypothetical protein